MRHEGNWWSNTDQLRKITVLFSWMCYCLANLSKGKEPTIEHCRKAFVAMRVCRSLLLMHMILSEEVSFIRLTRRAFFCVWLFNGFAAQKVSCVFCQIVVVGGYDFYTVIVAVSVVCGGWKRNIPVGDYWCWRQVTCVCAKAKQLKFY